MHVLLTTRRIGPDGFAGKERAWNDRALLTQWRQERAGRTERVDHRSLVDQQQAAHDRGDLEAAGALNRAPGVHLGRAHHQEARTQRPTARVTRVLEGDQRQPRPSGLERVSRFDREIRAAIEKTAAALRQCLRELRDETERLGWMDADGRIAPPTARCAVHAREVLEAVGLEYRPVNGPSLPTTPSGGNGAHMPRNGRSRRRSARDGPRFCLVSRL